MNLDQALALLAEFAARVPDAVWAAAGFAAMLFLLWQSKRAITKAATPAADLLTYVAAAIATGVSAQGMWHFFEVVFPGLPIPLRVALFAFIEIGMLASAVRARRNMRDSAARAKTDPFVRPSAGIDGTAVWVLTGLTAVLSSLEAASPPEFIFRLAAPLVAAWLWERGMAIERQRITGRSRINWRLTPERVLVRLGLAEANDRTASEVDAHRRLKRVALAAKKVHQLRTSNAKARQLAGAVAKRDRMLDLAVAHTDVATNPKTQAVLLDLASTLGGGDDLTSLLASARAPWQQLDHPAITGAMRHSEATALAEETRRLTDAVLSERDPEAAATIEMLAAMLTGRRVLPPTADTSGRVAPGVADLVAGRVSLRAVPLPPNGTVNDTHSDTGNATDDPVAPGVADEVADLDADEILRQLREEPDDTGDSTETATASATEAMWRYWQNAIENGELPTGADLAREGGCVESYGRRKKNEWLSQLDGRIRRRLLGSTRRERNAS